MRIHVDKYGNKIAETPEHIIQIIENNAKTLSVRMYCPGCFKSIVVLVPEAKRVFNEKNCNYCNPKKQTA